MNSAQRWLKLLVLVMAVALAFVTTAVIGQESTDERAQQFDDAVDRATKMREDAEAAAASAASHVHDEAKEAQQAAADAAAQARETVEQVTEQVKETVAKKVPKAPKKEKSPATTANGGGVLGKVKTSLTSVVDKAVSQSKALVKRAKAMDKSDVKKVAAAVVGIWGVAVGIGYVTNQAGAGGTVAAATGRK
jgi:vacuolar-type H+-ATPase subunit E/Vma4